MGKTTTIERRGVMLVLSSPSGAGKSSIARSLLSPGKDAGAPEVTLSVSVTTRPRRGSEVDGVHYKFLSERDFAVMRERDELLEWAEVHGNFYGTPRGPVEEALAAGRDVLFDIDWQGTLQLYDKARDDIVSIFILPPSMAELKSRLERRAEDSPEVIERRLANARTEIAHWQEYDYVIVNDDLDRALADVRAILAAGRLKRERRPGLEAFVKTLMG